MLVVTWHATRARAPQSRKIASRAAPQLQLLSQLASGRPARARAAPVRAAAMSGRGQQQQEKGPSRCARARAATHAARACRLVCALLLRRRRGARVAAVRNPNPGAPAAVPRCARARARRWQQRAAGKAQLYAHSTEQTTLGVVRPPPPPRTPPRLRTRFATPRPPPPAAR
jgi:hypothetical protein